MVKLSDEDLKDIIIGLGVSGDTLGKFVEDSFGEPALDSSGHKSIKLLVKNISE